MIEENLPFAAGMTPNKLEIIDVGPRDGLQNEAVELDTGVKVEFITRLVEAGIRRLEVASFVNPKRVPRMADAEDVLARLPRDLGATYMGLVLNRRGFDRAVEAKVDQVNFVVVASDTFNRRNQGVTSDETLAIWEEIATAADQGGIFCGATIGAAFGCPFEGEVPVERVRDIAKRLADTGAREIALADTIGVAVPSDVLRRVEAVREVIGDISLRCHFHNTRNTGLANAFAALEAGISILDASCGGLGGCPFAPAATGNIPTEDLLYMAGRMGLETGVDLEKLIEVSLWIEEKLGRKTPAMVSKAGPFPRNLEDGQESLA